MDNDNQKTSAKGIAQGTSDAVKKIMRIKKIAVTVSTVAPALGVVFLVILAAVIVFLPIISTYSFTGGIFNSSTSNNEEIMMPMNLEGFTEEDVRIFQTLKDGRDEYKNLEFKKKSDEEIDLSLLISTIQNQGLINFNDEGEVFDLDSEIEKSEEQIKNFETLDDFNSYVNKYGHISSDSNQKEDYHGETIIENKQNPAFYNNLKDKGGSVYYIYPGNRMLLGYMVSNDVSYYAVEYERWICDGDWCDNSDEIWSDWSILRKITSDNGENATCHKSGSAWGAVCNINSGVSFAESYSGDSNSWEYKNIKYDLNQLADDVLGGYISTDAASVIESMVGYDAVIPDGNFVPGRYYVAVSVEKSVDYNLYENYVEDVFIKHLYLDCDNCEYKNESNEVKKKKASTIYTNIYNIKELFNYFNDETVITYSGHFGSYIPTSGFAYLPDEFYDQLISPLESSYGTTLTSCVGYYDAIENTSYYCTGHDAADIAGSGGIIVAPADGVVTSCYTDYGSWGPLLGITHTLKDKDGNDVEVISWYRHWVDMNGNIDCSTFDDRVVKQGEAIAKESNQAGKYSVGTHLHFKLVSPDGEVYYIEDFLTSKGVNTNSAFGTTDCDSVRRICDEYCEDNECTSTYAKN